MNFAWQRLCGDCMLSEAYDFNVLFANICFFFTLWYVAYIQYATYHILQEQTCAEMCYQALRLIVIPEVMCTYLR